MATSTIPVIDPAVRFVGVSKLRDLNATKLRDSADITYVLQDNDQPLAVLLSYDKYLMIQQQLQQGMLNTIEMLTNEEELQGVRSGLEDVVAGRTRPFSQIKASLKAKNGKENR